MGMARGLCRRSGPHGTGVVAAVPCRSGGAGADRTAHPLRALLAVLAVVLLLLGIALFVAPTRVADVAWPWALTPLVGRAVGAWCIGLGVAAGHSWLIDDAPSLAPVGLTAVLFGALQAVALLRYGDSVDWSSVAGVGYLVGLAAITVAGVWLLVEARRTPTPRDRGLSRPRSGGRRSEHA